MQQGIDLSTANHGPYKRLKPAMLDPREIVYKGRSEQMAEIEAMIGKLENSLAKTIYDALYFQKGSIDLNKIIDALQTGDIGKVLALLDDEAALAALKPITSGVQSGVYAAGAATAALINTQIKGAQFVFGQLNPRLIDWLQTYSLGLIKQINDSTKEGVRELLISGMTGGENPKDVARKIKGVIGLTDKQTKAVQNYRKELESFHNKRTAGGYNLGAKIDRVNGTQVLRPDEDGLPKDGITQRRLRDFRYDGKLKQAMESGKPLAPEQIDKMVEAYERKYLAYRARTIARTEAARTTNFGVQDAWRQAIEEQKVDEKLIRRRFIVSKDERLCSVCGPIPSLNPKQGVKVAQPFNTPKGPVFLPPIHPNCRCTVFIRAYEPEQLKGA